MPATTMGEDDARNSTNMRHINAAAHRNFYDSYNSTNDINDSKQPVTGSSTSSNASKELLLASIRNGIIGNNEGIDGPFGIRPLIYADYTASARALSFIEDYIRGEVLPLYANTHTLTSTTGMQTTMLRREARDIILRNVHASKDDVAFFAGTGTTGAVMLLLHILGMRNERKEESLPVVFVGPYEHHSNLLPWREVACDVVVIDESNEGGVDLKDLEAKLIKYGTRKTKIGSFSAASNVSGILTDTLAVTALLHRYGALSFWDYASAAPYIDIDMNPKMSTGEQALYAKDGIMLSPHKMIGGVGTPGVLIIKKQLLLNFVPSSPGGGTVFFVSPESHRFLENFEEREEGGTPDIVGAIRCGLVFQLKEAVGVATIHAKETLYATQALSSWTSNPNIVIMGNPIAKRLPIISFLIRGKSTGLFLHPNFVSVILNDVFGIQSRAGCLCAGPYAQNVLGIDAKTAVAFEQCLLDKNEVVRPGFVRVNFNYFIDQTECDYIIDAVNWVADHAWKLLPSYGFFVDSGEWKHRSRMTKFVGRRWLGRISYSSGSMTYQSEHIATPRGALKQFITSADNLVSRAVASYASAPDMTDFLPSSAQALRWFMLPSDALHILRATSVAESTRAKVMPIIPKFDFPMMEVTSMPPVVTTSPSRSPSSSSVVMATIVDAASSITPTLASRVNTDSTMSDTKSLSSSLPSSSSDIIEDDFMSALPSGILVDDDGSSSSSVTTSLSSTTNSVNWAARERNLSSRDPAAIAASAAATAARRQERNKSKRITSAQQRRIADDTKRAPSTPTLSSNNTTSDNDSHGSSSSGSSNGKGVVGCAVLVCQPVVRKKMNPEEATPPSARKLQRRAQNELRNGLTTPSSGDDICNNCYHRHATSTNDGKGTKECLSCPCITFVSRTFTSPKEVDKLLRNLCQQTAYACKLYNMIQHGDRILVGVSGGKDSLTLVHILVALQKRAPVRFEIGCVTVDPQTPEYDPSVLKGYFKSLGIPYFYESQAIMENAKLHMDEKKISICSFCSRMKRGILYACCRREKYNVLALGQHLDDLAESFIMSAFHNGFLRTMKANYHVEAGDIRIIRPLCLIRERLTRQYAKAAELPVINENCPACYEAPKERQRAKLMLAAQEHIHPQLFSNLLRTMTPLMKKENKAFKSKQRTTTSTATSATTSTT